MQDRVTVEDRHVDVHDRRRLSVRIEGEIGSVVLLSPARIDRDHFVFESGLLQEEHDLGGVGRRMEVELGIPDERWIVNGSGTDVAMT